MLVCPLQSLELLHLLWLETSSQGYPPLPCSAILHSVPALGGHDCGTPSKSPTCRPLVWEWVWTMHTGSLHCTCMLLWFPWESMSALFMVSALWQHFWHGPHFRTSSSRSRHLHSCRLGHLLNIMLAFPCLWPGQYSMLNWYADRVSNHLDILSLGSLQLHSHLSAWWSVQAKNHLPRR